MGHKTVFSTQARVLMCKNCGAPIEAANAAGRSDCTFCQAQNQIVGRSQTLVAPVREVPLPEEERIARLRAQVGRPSMLPPSLLELQEGGFVPAWKMTEALAVWKQTRAELEATHSPDAAERLTFLCLLLAQTYKRDNDQSRRRAVYESTLDAVTLPRHRQIMLCGLSRAAAATNDLESAEDWLKLCDVRSDDLETDSEYRHARATIDTAAGRYDRVLQVLGATNDAVPVQAAMWELCVVFRANALEKLGEVPHAVVVLRDAMATGEGAQAIASAIRVWAGFCSVSYPLAQQSVRTRGGGRAILIAAMALFVGLGIAWVLVWKATESSDKSTQAPPVPWTTPEPPAAKAAEPPPPVAYNDTPEVRAVVRQIGRPITKCLDLTAVMKAGGVRFVVIAQVDAAGKVTSSSVTYPFEPAVTACIQKTVNATTFPAPPEGRGKVQFPVIINAK